MWAGIVSHGLSCPCACIAPLVVLCFASSVAAEAMVQVEVGAAGETQVVTGAEQPPAGEEAAMPAPESEPEVVEPPPTYVAAAILASLAACVVAFLLAPKLRPFVKLPPAEAQALPVAKPPPPAAVVDEPASATPTRRSARSPSIKRNGTPMGTPSKSPKVKSEAERKTPSRSCRKKSGYYAQSNLESLAWKGEGSLADPIQLT